MNRFDSLGNLWDSSSFRVKMMSFVDFQRVYHDLSRCFGFDDLESSKGMFQDVLIKEFCCLVRASLKGLKSVGFWGF